MIQLGGVTLPVTTPFDTDTGDVSYSAFRENLERWAESDIRGVLIGGSTGESVFLEDEERTEMIRVARAALPEDRIIIAGTGAESTRRTIRNTLEAAEAGAHAVLVKPPVYFKGAMGHEALATHYTAVAEASPIPVIVYQVPLHLSTMDLPTALVAELSRHANIVGIKDSRGKPELVEELLAACADDFQVLVGNGALLLPALELGAVGGIVAVGLLAAGPAVEVYRAFRDGRLDPAREAQARIAPVHREIVGGRGVPGVKVALDLLGFHGGVPRPPLAPFPAERSGEIREILETAQLAGVGAA
ncbi:MAG: dihydrodipicolinate synthase family protein [Gemmatimonadota bacterium]|nr:dihydrodipicolinate synthase family protein [Gemmatimonadota bacterium]